jgi:hypothetical protein
MGLCRAARGQVGGKLVQSVRHPFSHHSLTGNVRAPSPLPFASSRRLFFIQILTQLLRLQFSFATPPLGKLEYCTFTMSPQRWSERITTLPRIRYRMHGCMRPALSKQATPPCSGRKSTTQPFTSLLQLRNHLDAYRYE